MSLTLQKLHSESVSGCAPDAELAAVAAFAERAATVLERFHCDLPAIRLTHGLCPVAELRALVGSVTPDAPFESRLQGPVCSRRASERVFEILARAGDRHTTAFRSAGAESWSIPLCLEDALVGERRAVCVAAGSTPDLEVGSVVTHWNGVPIERALAARAGQVAGSHPAARRALALRSLTGRTSGNMLEPQAEWVDVTFAAPGGPARTRRFGWRPSGLAVGASVGARAAEAGHTAAEPDAKQSSFPAQASWGWLSREEKIGRLRLRRMVEVEELEGLRDWLGRVRGLVLDLRGNGGGAVETSDWLLGLLGGSAPPRRQLFQFRDTRATRDMLARHGAWRSWAEPSEPGWLAPRPITAVEALDPAGALPRVEWVVVLVDALTYSAAELLAAGLRQRRGALLVGPDPATGGGGANAWSYPTLQQLHPTAQVALERRATEATWAGAATRDAAVRRWAAASARTVHGGASCETGGTWMVSSDRGSETCHDVLQWLPEHDTEHLSFFDRSRPALPDLPDGFGLQLAVRRAVSPPGPDGACRPLGPQQVDVQLQRSVEDLQCDDARLLRRCAALGPRR